MTTTAKIVWQRVRLQQQALQPLVAELSAARNGRPSLGRTSPADDPLQPSARATTLPSDDLDDDDSDGSCGSATDPLVGSEHGGGGSAPSRCQDLLRAAVGPGGVLQHPDPETVRYHGCTPTGPAPPAAGTGSYEMRDHRARATPGRSRSP